MVNNKISVFFIILFSILAGACQNVGTHSKNDASAEDNISVNASGRPEISFSELEYDFGKVYEGEVVGWYFTYKNTGSKNLIIQNVIASCGCTVPSYSLEPLPPGSEDKIKVVFNSYGRTGFQQKTVTVETNCENKIIELQIKAEVIKKININ